MEGRVEECHNQVWWAVSDSSSYLDYRDAIIVCRPQQTVCRNCHFILLGVRIRSVASRASPWPLNQHVWISRSGTCFWDGRLCMCNEVWKVWALRRKAKRTHYVERAQECERVFEPHRMWRYSGFSRQPCTLFASLGAAAPSHTHRSRHGLHGAEAAFTLCLLLRFSTRILALSSSLPS